MRCVHIILVVEKPDQAPVQVVVVVVAVIKVKKTSLQVLTAAALLLPGLVCPVVSAAEDDEFDFQFSRYQEGKRNLGGVPNTKKPIEVNSINGGAKLTLSDRVKFAFKYTQDTWSGATPIATAPLILGGNKALETKGVVSGASPIITGSYYVNKNNWQAQKPIGYTPDGFPLFSANNQLVHTISVASPETRKQGDFNLGYEWDDAALNVGGGTSVERDYESNFGNVGSRFDFNQKLTSLNLGLSYTSSYTNALLDHDASPYIDKTAYVSSGNFHNYLTGGRIQAAREDWAPNIGLTQVLGESSIIQAGLGYSHAIGYMANPYKVVEVGFIDPNQVPDLIDPLGDGKNYFGDGRPANIVTADVKAFLEKRPTIRNQFNVSSRFVQYIKPLDAALHFDYHFSSDDWGITSHTFESDWMQSLGSGWTLTPRVRYYSQDAADFYTPYLLINQKSISGTTGKPSPDYLKLPSYYSSDQRLSGFGALSGGVSLTKKFSKSVMLETGFEYYTHDGGLKMGGGGEGSYANFNYYVVNAAIKVNLASLSHSIATEGQGEHDHDHGAPIPAGVMFGHMLDKPGKFMVGYRYMRDTQAGSILQGTHAVADSSIVNQGCSSAPIDKCFIVPKEMNMNMHMLDLMYAPTDWLNLMLMPQFVDMNMSMRQIAKPLDYHLDPNGNKLSHITHHIDAGHSTGGVGDTGMYALFKLWNTSNNHVHLTVGTTAPTGSIDNMLRRNHQVDGGFNDYGMQLGSGTWDFKSNLTYTGHWEDWSWGAQVGGTQRLQERNSSGYALGDVFQSTAWGSYNLFSWLSSSVRGVYTEQGKIKNHYNGLVQALGPMDYPRNYGGRYWDVGFGLNAFVPSGNLVGNNLSVEWLEPVSTDVNGYQLNRDGALSATWSYMF